MAQSVDFRALLELLCRHQVDFIVVGGVAAVLQGAPVATFDLDLVHARGPQSVGRLLEALQEVDARYRDPADRRLLPTAELLAGDGHHLLMTSLGPLDLLGRIGRDGTYETLTSRMIGVSLGSRRIAVLDLAALIQMKEEVGHEKDRAMLPILRRLLEGRGR